MMTRAAAKNEFQRISKTGRRITLRQFANELPDLIGEDVPLQTIRMWSFTDGWFHGIEEIDIVELSRLTKLFDKTHASFESAISAGPYSAKEASSYGRSLREVCARIPQVALPYFEENIISSREMLFAFLDTHWNEILANHSGSLLKTYLDLERYVIDSLVPDEAEGTVDADAILMSMH